jgi:Ca2+-binding RTX toxin-like protein
MRGAIRKSLGLCAGLLLLIPASALAGEASVVGGIARYDADSGETNKVTVAELPGNNPAVNKTIRFVDAVKIDPRGGCFRPFENTVRIVDCIVPLSSGLVRAGLGNQDDRLEPVDPNTSFGFSVEGDVGNDVLIGTQKRDVLDGVSGDDTLRGRSGNDALEGASGNDDLRGDAGDDEMLGGAGDDVLDGDDNGLGDDNIDCGESWFDDDLGIFNTDDTVSNCERIRHEL